MPFVARLKFCLGAEKIKRSSAIEGVDLDAICDGSHSHLPISGVSARMEVTVIHQSFQFQLKRLATPQECVLHVRGVFTLAHPDPLFDKRITECELPDGSGAFQPETLDVQITLGFDSAAQPAVCGNRIFDAGMVSSLVQFCDKLCSTHGRVERSNQETVITTRQIAADGS